MIAADLAWVLLSVAMGFPGPEERIFQTLVAALTLAMVFVIQHTQAREQAATSASSMRSCKRCPVPITPC